MVKECGAVITPHSQGWHTFLGCAVYAWWLCPSTRAMMPLGSVPCQEPKLNTPYSGTTSLLRMECLRSRRRMAGLGFGVERSGQEQVLT